jgi:hypothetical protein
LADSKFAGRINRQSKELSETLKSAYPLPHTTATANNANGRKPQDDIFKLASSGSQKSPNKMPPNPAGHAASDPEAKKKAARETIDILHEISTLLVRPKNHVDHVPIYKHLVFQE